MANAKSVNKVGTYDSWIVQTFKHFYTPFRYRSLTQYNNTTKWRTYFDIHDFIILCKLQKKCIRKEIVGNTLHRKSNINGQSLRRYCRSIFTFFRRQQLLLNEFLIRYLYEYVCSGRYILNKYNTSILGYTGMAEIDFKLSWQSTVVHHIKCLHRYLSGFA